MWRVSASFLSYFICTTSVFLMKHAEKIKMSSIKAPGTNLKTQKPKQQRRRSRWDTGGNVKMETEEHRPQEDTELQMQASPAESGFWPSSERFSHRHLWIFRWNSLLSSRAYREEARLNLVLTNRHNQSYHSHKRTIKKNSSYFIINKWAIFIKIAALSSGINDITEVFQTVALHLHVAQGSATLRAHALLTRQSLSSSAVKHQLKMNIVFYSVRL